jgi:hypothetical protein
LSQDVSVTFEPDTVTDLINVEGQGVGPSSSEIATAIADAIADGASSKPTEILAEIVASGTGWAIVKETGAGAEVLRPDTEISAIAASGASS